MNNDREKWEKSPPDSGSQRTENSNSSTPCVTCNGHGVREMDIGDSNDVEVTCDDCHGTGVDQ